MVPLNLKVLANLTFVRIASKNYTGARLLVLAKFLQVLARMLGFSLVLLCGYSFIYKNDKSVMKWL